MSATEPLFDVSAAAAEGKRVWTKDDHARLCACFNELVKAGLSVNKKLDVPLSPACRLRVELDLPLPHDRMEQFGAMQRKTAEQFLKLFFDAVESKL